MGQQRTFPLERHPALKVVAKLQKQLADQQGQINRLRQSLLSPTVPRYDPDFPDDAVDGQFALTSTPPPEVAEPTKLPYYFTEEAWHPLSGRPGKGLFKYIGTQLEWMIDGGGGWISDFEADGDTTAGYDPTLFSVWEKGLRVHQLGLFLLRTQLFWYADWGHARLRMSLSDGPFGEFPADAAADAVMGFDSAMGTSDASSEFFVSGYGSHTGFWIWGMVLLKVTAIGADPIPIPQYFACDLASPPEGETTTVKQFAMQISKSPLPDQS